MTVRHLEFAARWSFAPRAAHAGVILALVALAACGEAVVQADGRFEEFFPDAGPSTPGDGGPRQAPDAGSTPVDAGPQYVLRVESLFPTRGPTSGGTRVTLTGKSFANGIGFPGDPALRAKTTIRFGGNPALDFRVVDDDTIEVTSPTGLPGLQDVEVQNPNGRAVCAACFRYYEPVVLKSISPSRGPTEGGTAVVLTGSGFEEGVQVLFGARAAAAVNVVSPTRVQAFAPPGATAGAVDVTVAGTGGMWSLRRAFVYFDPTRVVSVSPAVGPLAGGNTIVVRGAGFTVTSIVFVDNLACTDPALAADGSLSCKVPARATPGAVDVTVRTAGAGEDTLVGGYTYVDPAARGFALYGVTPRRGPSTGGNTLILTGSGFTAGNLAVRVGPNAAPLVRVDSDWQATVTAPPGMVGLFDVQARSDAGGGRLSGAYRYDAPVVISRVTPDSAPASGVPETTVTLEGAGFHGTLDTVLVGGQPALVLSASPTQIVITAPRGGEGPTEIVVRSPAPDGFLREGRAPFRFTAPLSLVYLDPPTGAMSGGQLVTLVGSGFKATTRVLFSAAQAQVQGSPAPNRLVVRAPPGEEGVVDVTVQDGAASDTLAQAFTYYDPTSPSGGLSGGPMQGTLNVVVLELDQDGNAWPVEGARVYVGIQNPLAAYTDARGMVTFSDPSLVKSVTVTVSKENFATATVEGVQSRNLTVFLTRNGGAMGPPSFPPPQEPPPPASLSGRVYGMKKLQPCEEVPPGTACRTLSANERWVARVYHAPPSTRYAPPYLNDLVERNELDNPCKEYGWLGYKTVTREGGVFEFEQTFYGQQAIYAVFGVENTTTLEFEPYLMGIRQGIDGKAGVHEEGQDIVLSIHLDQTVPMKVEQPLSYLPGPVSYLVFAYIDLGGEGVIPIPTQGTLPEPIPAGFDCAPSTPQTAPQAFPILFDVGDRHTLTRMPPIPGENLMFFVWAWSGNVASDGTMDYPISFNWRRQPGDLSRGLTVGPLLGLPTAIEPVKRAVFTGRIAWSDTSGGAPPDIALVDLYEPTLFGWKPWLNAVVPGGQGSVTVPVEALAAYFPPGTPMAWLLVTARAPRLDYDAFTYNDVYGRGWTSWAVEMDWTITP